MDVIQKNKIFRLISNNKTILKQSKNIVLGVLLTTAFANTASAEKLVGATSKVSTLGLGGELNMAMSKRVELMMGINLLDVPFGYKDGDQKYDGTVYLNTLYTGLRVHPWENGLYFGGGVALNNNKIQLKAKPKGEKYEFDGKSYNAESVGTVKTTGTFFKVSPMLLMGWESKNINETGMSFFGELGVLVSFPPTFEHNVLCSKLSASSCGRVKQSFQEEQNMVEKALKPTWAYPVIGAGVRYRF